MDNEQHQNGILEPAGEDEALQTLFQHANARQRPPQTIEQEIRTELHQHWQNRIRASRRRKTMVALGLAASFAAVLLVAQPWLSPGTAPLSTEPVGMMVKHNGQVTIRPPGNRTAAPEGHPPGALFTGHDLETGLASTVALHWTGGESIRLGERTRVRLSGTLAIDLLAGSIYIDSGELAAPTMFDAHEALTIRTVAGEIRHIGTQYMARLHGEKVEVSVREGRVAILTGQQQSEAGVGEQLTLEPDAEVTRRQVRTWGDLWAWTEIAAPAIDLDGRTVLEFLQHIARESGHELAFSDAQAEDIARRSMLSGSIDLPPMEALDVVLQTTDLMASTDSGRILVHSR